MKTVIALSALLIGFNALADIPMPPGKKPKVEPGPTVQLDSDALSVLVYALPAAKITALKTGANTIRGQRQLLDQATARYTFSSCQMISGGAAGGVCIGNKAVTVVKTTKVVAGKPVTSYEVSEVGKIR